MRRRAEYGAYTIEELKLVLELYPKRTAAQIAELIFGTGRAALAIYRLARVLGLRKWPCWPPETIDGVRRLHARGLSDVEIAGKMGMSRDQVHNIRYARLKLPPNADAILQARRRGVKTQFKRLGIRHGGDLRRLAFQKYAKENGWPEDLRPREVQILNILAERGPMTMYQLSVAIGMRTDRIGCNGRPALLMGNGPGGTYTATLMRRGLIMTIKRWAKGRPKGQAREPNVYLLTPQAISILERTQQDGTLSSTG
jgi:hypothetical protein